MSRLDLDQVDAVVRSALRAEDGYAPDVASARAGLRQRVRQAGPEATEQGRRRPSLPMPGWAAPTAVAAATVSILVAVPILRPDPPAGQPGMARPAASGAATRPPTSTPPAWIAQWSANLTWQVSTAQRTCGPGYRLLHQPIGGGLSATSLTWDGAGRPPKSLGSLFLFWNPKAQRACGVAIKNRGDATANLISTYLQPDGRSRVTASGRVLAVVRLRVPTSAMPPAAPGKGAPSGRRVSCVRWGGEVGKARFDSVPVHYTSYYDRDEWPC